MSGKPEQSADPKTPIEIGDGRDCEVETAWAEHREALFGFLRGLLRDEHAAADCLQTTFSKLIETGGPPVAGNLRGWLFRVAHNCARELQRRSQVERRGLEQVAILRQLADGGKTEASNELFIRRERLEQARIAIRQLSTSQQDVLRMRIEDGMKFAEIAHQLNLPLGTVLTRMRLGLESVRRRLEKQEAESE